MTEYMESVSDPERDDISFDYLREESIFKKTFSILKETLGEYAFQGSMKEELMYLGS